MLKIKSYIIAFLFSIPLCVTLMLLGLDLFISVGIGVVAIETVRHEVYEKMELKRANKKIKEYFKENYYENKQRVRRISIKDNKSNKEEEEK